MYEILHGEIKAAYDCPRFFGGDVCQKRDIVTLKETMHSLHWLQAEF